MPTVNPLKAEYQRVGGPRVATVAALTENWIVPTLDGYTVSDFTAGALISFVRDKKVWLRDDTDQTSLADGVNIWVTADQVRFKSTAIYGSAAGVWSVLAFQNDPPTVAAAGDTYGVGSAPTGAWAAKANCIATCLIGGGTAAQIWTYTTPTVGLIARDKTRKIFRSYDETLAWVDGLSQPFAARSIAPEALAVQRFSVQATVTAPPGSPADGLYWLIGTGATGAFAGRAGQIAKSVSGAWTYLTAFSGGDQVWDIAAQAEYTYIGGLWTSASQPKVVAWSTRLIRGGAAAATGAALDFATAPNSSNGISLFPEGAGNVPSYTLQQATNRLLIRGRTDCTKSAAATFNPLTIALFIDGALAPLAGHWQNFLIGANDQTERFEFEHSVNDTAAHIYNIRAYGGNGIVRAELQFAEVK